MAEQGKREVTPEEAQAFARFEEEMRRMSVDEHLVAIMQSLVALAVRKLGGAPDAEGERDIAQARQAIEAFKALLPVIEPSRPAEEMHAHRSVLSELQMAYVSALGGGHPEPAGGDSDQPPAPDERPAPDGLSVSDEPATDEGEAPGGV